MEDIVLDTNCLIASIKRSSRYFPVWKDFMQGKYCLCFTDEILDEYEEIITQQTGSAEIARNIISAILNRTNTKHIEVYYHFGLIEADKAEHFLGKVDHCTKTHNLAADFSAGLFVWHGIYLSYGYQLLHNNSRGNYGNHFFNLGVEFGSMPAKWFKTK